MPWFPGDAEPQTTSGGVEDRALSRPQQFTPRPAPDAVSAQLRNHEGLMEVRDTRILVGAYFPPAVQPIGPATGRFYGDAGDGDHQLRGGAAARYPQDAGRDTPTDTPGPNQQFIAWATPFWGMRDAATDYRNRFLVALDEPSAAGRPIFAPRSLEMRPSATAVNMKSFGDIPTPAGARGATRRAVAAGWVTRWNQPSLVWPDGGGG